MGVADHPEAVAVAREAVDAAVVREAVVAAVVHEYVVDVRVTANVNGNRGKANISQGGRSYIECKGADENAINENSDGDGAYASITRHSVPARHRRRCSR